MPSQSRQIYPGEKLPLIYGHRGYSALAPENTLNAFKLLLDRGIPGVELDVQLCKTGELVVIHDFDLKRLAGANCKVVETSLKDLKTYPIGPLINKDFKEDFIPTLEEVFSLLGNNVYYDVELKSMSPDCRELAEKAVNCVKKFKLEERVMISSFNPFAIKYARSYNFKRTALIYSKHKEVHWYLRRGEGRLISHPAILKPCWEHLTGTSLFLDHKLAGYPMVTWTIDKEDEAVRLFRKGVEGFIANDPGKIQEALKSEILLNQSR